MLSSRPWQALRTSPHQCHGQLLSQNASSQRRWASLSAIHRGRATEQRRGGRSTSLEGSPVPLNRTERSLARAAAADQTFRIRKGKKDITQKAVPDSLTRQARFYNPNFSHGKKSLVYQLKTGLLQDKLRTLKGAETRSRSRSGPVAITKTAFEDAFKGQSPFGRGDDGARIDYKARTAARDRLASGGTKPKITGNWADRASEGFRPSRETRRINREDMDVASGGGGARARTGFGDGRDTRLTERPSSIRGAGTRETRSVGGGRETRMTDRLSSFGEKAGRPGDNSRESRRTPEKRDSEKQERRWSPEQHKEFHRTKEQSGPRNSLRKSSSDHEPERPVSIEYTTAASQFLYGKSVVEAALKTSTRRLYKLYIYAGANRENVDVDEVMVKLARKKGIPVRNEHDSRLMDKMSGGRPHNGYILEASPIPQLPLRGLGPYEDAKERSGFKVELAHQSAEDAEINGTDDFIRTVPSSHKPLVVVLDQILDPQNLGAILRSVNFLGATAVAITKRNSATLTPVALKASAGASEAITLFSVDNLAPFLDKSKESGWKVYTAVPLTSSGGKHRQMSIHDVEEEDPLAKDPCILLLGGEGEGLSKQLKSKADFEVNIRNMSQTNLVDSLNVSVAAGLLTYSLLRGKAKAESEAFEKKRETLSLF
ncbi:RNA methyltransferase [Coniochaeta sp. PMI_546]|nr:RNA methyltransferase [Coniochaeta sp. PMI_546]